MYQRIDESVHSQLREKMGERLEVLAKGLVVFACLFVQVCMMCCIELRDEKQFEETFSYACPKFLSPVLPNYDGPRVNLNKVQYTEIRPLTHHKHNKQAHHVAVSPHSVCLARSRINTS